MIGPLKSERARQSSAVHRHNWPSRSFFREVLGNVSIAYAKNALAWAFGFVTTRILVRHFQPEEYGIFSVFDMVPGFSAGFLATGLNWPMIRSLASCKSQPAKAWYLARPVMKIELVYGIIVA